MTGAPGRHQFCSIVPEGRAASPTFPVECCSDARPGDAALMPLPDQPRLLILETSGRTGQVAVAEGGVLRAVRALDETRRHARDLAPTVAELLAEQGWKPRDV